jgi:hypothetical protein
VRITPGINVLEGDGARDALGGLDDATTKLSDKATALPTNTTLCARAAATRTAAAMALRTNMRERGEDEDEEQNQPELEQPNQSLFPSRAVIDHGRYGKVRRYPVGK